MTVLKGKTIDRICAVALAVMLALTGVIWVGKASAGRQKTIEVGYEALFDQDRVHAIDIEIGDWEDFIATATQEEYVECSVTIDGERLSGVGIRAKGNTSLSSVASQDSEKYSFKLEFDHFVKGRLYKGLDKLSLNNLIYDATMMKDYLAYTLMAKMGVPSPLCSFVEITVNGEPWGLYLTVEGIEDGFMERNNMTTGELYKPDSMSFGGGRGNGRDFDIEQFREKDEDSEASDGKAAADGDTVPAEAASAEAPADTASAEGEAPDGDSSAAAQSGGFPAFPGQGDGGFPAMPSGDFTPPEGFEPPEGMQMPGSGEGGRPSFGGFNFGMGSSDVKLAYIDDAPDSYANIFNNAKTDVGKKDKARLIEALRKLSAGEDIDNTVFTDEVINYLAVHDFLQNDDSYTGMMVHNYYLYEEDGQLAIIPWDYNLAFGGMSGTDGTSLVNSPIDSPVFNGSTSDRPLIGWIFEDEEALARYHEAYDRFVSEVIESGWLDSEISRVAELIRPYVESDKNAFYTVEAFDEAVSMLRDYCALRGKSIRGQLDGEIPSTSDGQRAGSASLVDGSGLDVSAMGTMNSGGNGMPGSFPSGDSTSGDMPVGFPGGGMPGGFPNASPATDGAQTASESDIGTNAEAAADAESETPAGIGAASRENPEAQAASSTAADASDAAAADGQSAVTTVDPGATAADSQSETATETPDAAAAGAQSGPPNMPPSGMSMPEGFTPPGFEQETPANAMSWPEFGLYALLLLLAAALVWRLPGHNR